MSKPHVAFPESPLGRGSHVETACGEEIWHAKALHVWDPGEIPTLEPPKGLCPKCRKALEDVSVKSRCFVYVVKEMEKVKC